MACGLFVANDFKGRLVCVKEPVSENGRSSNPIVETRIGSHYAFSGDTNARVQSGQGMQGFCRQFNGR
jgi:hypothetical protein